MRGRAEEPRAPSSPLGLDLKPAVRVCGVVWLAGSESLGSANPEFGNIPTHLSVH